MKKFLLWLLAPIHCFCLIPSKSTTLSEVNTLQFIQVRPSLAANAKSGTAIFWSDFLDEDLANQGVKFSFKNGEVWSEPTYLPYLTGEIKDFQGHVDEEGNARVVWKKTIDSEETVWGMQMKAGSQWERPVLLYEGDDENTLISMLFKPNGNLLIFSTRRTDFETGFRNYYFYHLYVTQTTLSSPQMEKIHLLGEAASSTPNISFTTSPKNQGVVVWEKSSFPNTLSHAWEQEEGDWSYPQDVIFPIKWNNALQIACDAQHNIFVIGVTTDAQDHQQVWATLCSPKGRWSHPVMLSEKFDVLHDLQISADKAGNCLAVWSGSLEKKSHIFSAYKIVDQPWSEAVQISSPTQFSITPILKTTPFGDSFVVWQQIKQLKYPSIVGVSFRANSQKWSSPTTLSQDPEAGLLGSFEMNEAGKGTLIWLAIPEIFDHFLKATTIEID